MLARHIIKAAFAVAVGIVSIDAQAQEPPPASFNCTIDVAYAPGAGVGETFQHEFAVAVGTPYTHDTSTPVRQHVLNASVRPLRLSWVIDVDYFSDVAAVASVGVGTALRMKQNQRADVTSGRHYYYHSLSGSYSVSHTLRCTRL